MTRTTDGAAGDAGSGTGAGSDDRKYRRPEPSFARAIAKALAGARTILDVAGAVSYAPGDRDVTAVRDPGHLPFADDTFDAALTTWSVHQWDDLERGLAKLRRVTRGPIVILTRDPDRVTESWLAEYAPEVTAAEACRWPALDRIERSLPGDTVTSTALPVPFTCVDGFSEAYYARPERLLDPGARKADPAWDLVDEMTARRAVAALRTALESGDWDRAHGALRTQPTHHGSLVLVVATPDGHFGPATSTRPA